MKKVFRAYDDMEFATEQECLDYEKQQFEGIWFQYWGKDLVVKTFRLSDYQNYDDALEKGEEFISCDDTILIYVPSQKVSEWIYEEIGISIRRDYRDKGFYLWNDKEGCFIRIKPENIATKIEEYEQKCKMWKMIKGMIWRM